MTSYVWWVDEPRNNAAGGWLSYKEHALAVGTVSTDNNQYNVGFQCERGNYLPLMSDWYECFSYHSFLKFKVPTATSGSLDTAYLFLRLGGAEMLMNVNPIYMDIDIYHKEVYDPNKFPWNTLRGVDYTEGGWHKDTASIENFYELWGDYKVYGPHWITPVDVTEAVQEALDNGWEWIGIVLTPNYSTPLDWDYDSRPTPYDQKMWLGFFGPVNTQWVDAPDSDFPTGIYIPSCPWLKITYSGGNSQYVPGENVTTSGEGATINCIAADPKKQTAIVGASSGSLWVTISGGFAWNKIYEQDEPITAVWMDRTRNLQDYPDNSIAWFGTASGSLYKSVDSLHNWIRMIGFGVPIVEIMSTNIDSAKVVVGTEEGIWVTNDGGQSFVLVKEPPDY